VRDNLGRLLLASWCAVRLGAVLNLLDQVSQLFKRAMDEAHYCATLSGWRSCLRSSNVCCSLWDVWWVFTASRFRLSKPCRASSRSAGVENNEAEDRRPIDGIGIISDERIFSKLKLYGG